MPTHKLLVFGPNEKGPATAEYRIVVIDPHNKSGYPANFVCVLPTKIRQNGKRMSMFESKFGERKLAYAIELLKDSLKREQDRQTRAELKKRLDVLMAENNARLSRGSVQQTK
jgi:hypothetical protein